MSEDHKPPTIEERYGSAVNTSNMKVELDRRNVADILIAAGWSRSKLGVALARLRSEWDGSARPRFLPPSAVKVLAGRIAREEAGPDGKVTFKDSNGEVHRITPADAAKRQAHEWHMQELGLLFQKLKTLGEVRLLLAEYAWLSDFRDPHTKAAQVLSWWLYHTCQTCGGGKWEIIPGTNRHSNRLCGDCGGTGDAEIPCGWEGRRMLSVMDKSLLDAEHSMRANGQVVVDRKRWVLDQQDEAKPTA